MRRPDRRDATCGDAQKRQHSREDDRRAVLQTARRAKTDHLTHHQSEIETTGMNEETLQDIRVPTQMGTTHRARVIDMRERAFDQLPASSH
jgi:hypothetical protein